MKAIYTIKEIKERLLHIKDETDPFLIKVRKDERKGVQTLIRSWEKKREKEREAIKEFEQMKQYEQSLWEQGYQWIGGVDEVGRGPLAGPVVASCVILPKNFYLPGLTDSKKLSKEKREMFYDMIKGNATAVGVGICSAAEIDQFNIYEATKIAMQRAIEETKVNVDYLLLDAINLPISTPQTPLIKGDSKSISIAASSVIAKVTRDRYMEGLGEKYPEYGFENHMGYGTSEHLTALHTHGVVEQEHRQSFSPVKAVVSSS
ncbi:ribonuclease HII [Bacillus shivajii]|uniref:ribonuclease HII n=1 Tax=Bacillus shivajii TaxID=1983719 RepID=UPI001CFC05F0|nr:ribonuclease HII [Bacillus shivajii]UCZ51741.1 ribonuclease HII [Bacillus shivajii]